MTTECTFCTGTGVDPDGARCTWCDATGKTGGLSKAVRVSTDDVADTVTIEQITYSQELFRQLGGLMPVGQAFRLVTRSIGPYGNTLTIETIDSPYATLAALRSALSEIIVKVQESRSETRRLNWIEGRAQSALEGKPWVKGVFQMPDPKNGKPKEERLSRQLTALRADLANMTDLATSRGNRVDSLRERLTAAEQRNAELVELLRDIRDAPGGSSFNKHIDVLLDKPTESGASALDPKIIGIERMPPMEYDEP